LVAIRRGGGKRQTWNGMSNVFAAIFDEL